MKNMYIRDFKYIYIYKQKVRDGKAECGPLARRLPFVLKEKRRTARLAESQNRTGTKTTYDDNDDDEDEDGDDQELGGDRYIPVRVATE